MMSLFYPLIYIYLNKTVLINFLFLSLLVLFIVEYIKNKPSFIKTIPFKILSIVMRNYEKNSFMGSTYMIIGFTVITLFFPEISVIIAMLITILSDSFAAIIGIRYGRITIFHGRTLEGSFFFSLITLLILSFFSFTTLEIFFLTIAITMTELLTPTKYDNISVPLVTATLIYIIR